MRYFRDSLAGSRLFFIAAAILTSNAYGVETEEWNAKFQSTYIWQTKEPFTAAYSGPNSLATDKEKSYSFTATAAFGIRPWVGGELYFDPEVAQGVPLSNLTGLGGMSNGEMARTSGANPTFYRARFFLRQTFGFGGEKTTVDSAANQLADTVDKHRLVVTAGNLSVIDIFDANTFNHDPRTQFMNWSLMTHGAYDFAADSRGYTWGFAAEYFYDDWVVRGGRFLQPKESNGLPLNRHIFQSYGDQVEFEHAHQIADQSGKVRLLVFRNVATMGNYQDALTATTNGSIPAVADVRKRQAKVGYGINVEQAVTSNIGVFGRASWADGKTETYAFAEIDRSLSAGVLVSGAEWSRSDDTVGLAFVQNGLSSTHRDYLAAGGLGFFVGDGRINYRPERILETFYNVAIKKGTHIGIGFQHIENPAYNHDRGQASVASVRLHTEF